MKVEDNELGSQIRIATATTPFSREMKMNLKASLGFTVLALLLLCVFLGLQYGCATRPPTAAKLQRLQGYLEGELLGGSFKCSITFKGNSLHFYSRPDFWYKATFTLPAGTDPQQLSATIKYTAASATNDIGKVIVAIFKIEHGTLTLAVNQDPAGPPPKAFPSETNTVIARYDLKKAQPQKKNAEASTSSETGQLQQTTGNATALEQGRRHPAEIAKIVSGPDLVPVPIAFQNNSAAIRKVYWIDTNGERQLYLEIKPGESYGLGTYLSHPWVVTDAAGNALGLYYPDGQKRTVTLE